MTIRGYAAGVRRSRTSVGQRISPAARSDGAGDDRGLLVELDDHVVDAVQVAGVAWSLIRTRSSTVGIASRLVRVDGVAQLIAGADRLSDRG
jgi:hypothetical protein